MISRHREDSKGGDGNVPKSFQIAVLPEVLEGYIFHWLSAVFVREANHRRLRGLCAACRRHPPISW